MIVKVNVIEGSVTRLTECNVPDGLVPGEVAKHLEFTESVHQFNEPAFPFNITINRKESENEFLISVEGFGTCEYFQANSIGNLMSLFGRTLSPFLVPFYLEHFYKSLKSLQQQGNRPERT